MSAVLGLALFSPFLTLPSPVLGEPAVIEQTLDQARRRGSCLSLRCNDAEWRLASDGRLHGRATDWRSAAPGLRSQRRWVRLSAPARAREHRDNYSNRWRIGTLYGVQLMRDGPVQLGVEFGAGYRLAPRSDDGIGQPGPVFRGAIDFGREFGERTRLSQHVMFETGNGQAFVKQSLGLDIDLWPEWTLETDYVIRHRTYGASGSETAESWLGIRRRF
ncbi:DUF481 domain-containing protein [Marilutibacter maris]|uniref:DUF481 domain-containing protein n=1 Tax=Marilutibacter maris TaxID=1605891 RepID=A0A2U9T1B3_9GAMM|nr:DUF481 domain-containing protein [Lysobacter maris]AWV06161.1 hypothetical protein C9I47_0437 [Lysobacter maris]KAB8196930.1 DUF481 domain-containing protein [Lysobacter maris]